MRLKNLLIAIFFVTSCNYEPSDNTQNLSELILPDKSYLSSQYECTLNPNKNLNDLEQYIPKLSQLLKNHNFDYQLDFYFLDIKDDQIKNFLINVKNKEYIDKKVLSLFINSENHIFQCLQKNDNLVATTLISKIDQHNDIFYLEILDCEFTTGSNFGTFKIAADYFYNLLNQYDISYKADFLNSDLHIRNFYWHNFFNSSEDRDIFYMDWINSEDSIDIQELFSEQSECFSSSSYIGYKVY